MIQQKIGDLLEIEDVGNLFYVVVLTKVVMFGGNILFAFHNDGKKRDVGDLLSNRDGFNICADLLLPKRERRVRRLYRFQDLSRFWKSKYVKATTEYRRGIKAKEWFIYDMNDLGGNPIARVTQLTPAYRKAMDNVCFSFDWVSEKVLARYTPEQNEHI